MQIHVVQAGQSIFQIANFYNSSVSAIVRANEIPNPNNLVVGQYGNPHSRVVLLCKTW